MTDGTTDGTTGDGRPATGEETVGDRRPVTDGHPPSSVDGRPSPVGRRPSSRELKPEQKLAAHTLDRHVSVTAGPGAGKTTVLVERYLHILREANISVDQIVAITFTNRSANEMRERLRRELNNILVSAAPVERAKWMRHKRTLDGAIITTIHGFCARLLREFPVEAEIDPQFILLDAHQSAMLEEGVVEETLTEFISAKDSAMTELAAGVGRVRLVRGLIDIYRSMRNQGLTLETLAAKTAKTHKTLSDYKRAVGELAAKMREFIEVRGLPPSAEKKRIEAGRRWPALQVFLEGVSESTQPAEFSDAIQGFREATRPRSLPRVGELVKELDALIWEDNSAGAVPQSFFDLHASRYAPELIKVIGQIERRLDDEKRRNSALDFDDLQLRALRLLEQHPEVLRRASSRYQFFLVDEFQDTNGLQRELMAKLALGPGRQANLFIVGDRKQSIYGFRGADVDVFREMTSIIDSQNGLLVALNRNFRSQRPLIDLFNFMFEDVFQCDARLTVEQRNELGYVEHEASIVARDDADAAPLIELLVDLTANEKLQERPTQQKPRERDAEQLAARIASLVGIESISSPGAGDDPPMMRPLEYRDIALLFRAMTEVHLYESAFRRAGIPYVTVDGKGFYAREEITDFIQLLRFLDNKTDEVALAAVLRSPICGLSDNSLLALRCAPLKDGTDESGRIQRHNGVRHLLDALWVHESIDFIDLSERPVLDRARELFEECIDRARRSRLSDLLRFAVEASEYRSVAAANFDGAQRLANIEKLFTLAERFERSGAHLIRDFVRFVRDFEEAGGRESEGQIDDSADAVRVMSIHQSKGLEFPVVIIPDLHRQPDNRREWWAVDRHRGLTLKVPDGRGRLVAGSSYTAFADRTKRRDEFEGMRLLYVASTRAQDRLILSGAAKDLPSFRNSWLGWICKAFGIARDCVSGVLKPSEGVELRLTLNLREASLQTTSREDTTPQSREQLVSPTTEGFPLLEPVAAERGSGLHRFSVTQLLNYQRCPRQYYFDRLLHAPTEEEVAVWNDAEAPEPPANLTATLRGAVIHRFCEKFQEGSDLHECLKSSFEDVLRQKAAELADRTSEIDSEKALRDLLPLAQNYVGSKLRERIESARASGIQASSISHHAPGVFSEQRFRLRRPLGILTGTIDKLLIFPAANGEGLKVEIIDFKTNRFRGIHGAGIDGGRGMAGAEQTGARKVPGRVRRDQLSFEFLQPESETRSDYDLLMRAEIEAAAAEYQVQMQAYALAARDLIPEVTSVRVTLHFLDPDVEVSLSEELLERETCATAIDEIMLSLVSSSAPEGFPASPAEHCRMCNFRELCPPGRSRLSEARL
ncbi:MAG TPA: UvrD-helicase domain-containing protein [Blastocatellia bacterium]|nr:UvrD-helicase domain-containing protein [Blastocatellia bacterium]